MLLSNHWIIAGQEDNVSNLMAKVWSKYLARAHCFLQFPGNRSLPQDNIREKS